jgi:dihydrodipicolinate reductase
MSEKIKVAVAGFPSKLAMTVSQAICCSSDMKLFNHGLSEPDFANRHLQIACVYMEMYNMERTSLFFEKIEEANVLIDCSKSSEESHSKNLAYYESVGLPVILLTSYSSDKIDSILDEIRFSYQRDSCLRVV